MSGASKDPTLGAGGRQVCSERRRLRISLLCDLVSEDVPIVQAAKLIGVSPSSATEMMAQVRRELGWQAQ